MLYSSYRIFFLKIYFIRFLVRIIMLCLILVLTFSCSNMLNFYFYFEISLIPTLFIIIIWGYQPERLQAGVYFLFYTLTASLPLLIVLVYVYYIYGSLDYSLFFLGFLKRSSFFFTGGLTLAFLVKMPMFFVHL